MIASMTTAAGARTAVRVRREERPMLSDLLRPRRNWDAMEDPVGAGQYDGGTEHAQRAVERLANLMRGQFAARIGTQPADIA